jgi:hypothetical protein
MKSLFIALAMIAATLQPALAASCWSSANGYHLLFPPVTTTATYSHGGMVETCSLHALDRASARVWCDVSSVSGTAYLVAAHRQASRTDRLWWDGRYFARAACPTY